MSRWYLIVAVMLVGCGQPSVSSVSIDSPVSEPVSASPPKVFRYLALPDSETLPEQLRGKRVHEVGQMATAGPLSFTIHKCGWQSTGLAAIEWSVTNLGVMPARQPAIVLFSINGIDVPMYYDLDSLSQFSQKDHINPSVTRSGKSFFELPRKGKYVAFFQSNDGDHNVLIDCPLSEPAYEVVR